MFAAARGSVKCCVGLGITQCCGWGCWAASGPSFCTASRQNPLLPPLIVWWMCGSVRKAERGCQLHSVTSGRGQMFHISSLVTIIRDLKMRRSNISKPSKYSPSKTSGLLFQTGFWSDCTHTRKDRKLNADDWDGILTPNIRSRRVPAASRNISDISTVQRRSAAHHLALTWRPRTKNATHHFDTNSWKSLEKTPSGSLGGGWGGIKKCSDVIWS